MTQEGNVPQITLHSPAWWHTPAIPAQLLAGHKSGGILRLKDSVDKRLVRLHFKK
jgi:hypothetical protein